MILLTRNRRPCQERLDGSNLLPESLIGLSIEQIRCWPLAADGSGGLVGDRFDVSQVDGAEDELTIVGDCSHLSRIGMKMTRGTLNVVGDAGDLVGADNRGGTIRILGNAGGQVGQSQRSGLIYVTGDCGPLLAGPSPGAKSGMRGGDILVLGSIGERSCERLRRGTVFVGGDVGPNACANMIAGTLVCIGKIGDQWGGGMRRGSIVLSQVAESPTAASLSSSHSFELSFLPLLWKHLDHLLSHTQLRCIDLLRSIETAGAASQHAYVAPRAVEIPMTRWVDRAIGDLNYQGKGEVLTLRRISSIQSAPRLPSSERQP